MNEKPKISIVTPTFNCGPFIRECIESVMAQNYQNVEHIIVDGASNDGTVEILKEYPHLKWISEPDHGEAEALNKGLRMTTGDIIGWLGGDDRYVGKHTLDWVATKAAQLTGPYVLYGKGLFINERGEPIRLHMPKNPITLAIVSRWFNGHGLFQPSMFYSKHLLSELGEFREDLPYGIDYEYWLRIAARGHVFHYVDHVLGESREGARADSKSVTAPFETRANEWTKISAGYQATLTEIEQINFWKDYYSYRIQAQNQYTEPIAYPGQKIELLGFAVALDLCNHLSGLHEIFEALVQRFPECEDIYWLLGSCFARNGEFRKAEEIRTKMMKMLPPPQGLADNGAIKDKEWQDMNDLEKNRCGDLQQHDRKAFISETKLNEKKSAQPELKSRECKDEGLPLVSVIIPTFNRPERLVQAVQSVLSQTYACIEIIVINDGGCDVEPLLSSLPCSEKILYLRIGQNRERSHARNMGLNLARGKYIAYLDDDDRFYPDHVETLVSFLERTGHQVAYTDARRVFEELENGVYVSKKFDIPYSSDFNRDVLLQNNFIPILCLMHAKTCVDLIGEFNEELSTHEDWDFLIRLSGCFSVHHIKTVTAEFSWRTDGTSTTSQRSADFLRTREVILRKYHSSYSPQGVNGEILRGQGPQSRDRTQKSYDCSIVIPVYNRAELTEQCLTQLAKVTDGVAYEVIVVDNGSTDRTGEFLASLKGDIQIIKNNNNLGFSKACNQGARASKGKHLVFLNNDTIPRVGWLETLVHEVDAHSDVDIVGSKLLYPDNTIQHAGVVFSRAFHTPYHLFSGGHENLPAVNVRREFQAVTAACMLVRKETFEKIGGFDEGFVNGFEDVDLCLRVRQMGRKVIYQPKSCLYHLESQTPGRKKHDDENFLRLIARWKHQWLGDEDLMAAQTDYIIRQEFSEEPKQPQLIPKYDVADPMVWQRAVDLQQLLLGRECQPLSEMTGGQEIRDLLVEVEGWPNDIGILVWVGDVCEKLKLEQEAVQFWQKLLTIGDHPHARLGLARAMLKNGNLDEAQSHLEKFTRRFPPRVEGWSLQGILSMQRQEFSKAKQAFEKSLAIDVANRRARMGLGMACLGLGETAEAWSIFEQVVSVDPDDIEAMRCLIQTGTALQQWEDLASHLSRSIERNPADCAMRFALAGVQFRAGYPEKAMEHLTWLRLINPDFEGLEDLEGLLHDAQTSGDLVPAR